MELYYKKLFEQIHDYLDDIQEVTLVVCQDLKDHDVIQCMSTFEKYTLVRNIVAWGKEMEQELIPEIEDFTERWLKITKDYLKTTYDN